MVKERKDPGELKPIDLASFMAGTAKKAEYSIDRPQRVYGEAIRFMPINSPSYSAMNISYGLKTAGTDYGRRLKNGYGPDDYSQRQPLKYAA
jgi:hypothetical protein